MEIQIQSLQNCHDTEAFSCGKKELDKWFRQIAKQHGRKGISRSYVATDIDSPEKIVGFYSLTVGEAESKSLPEGVARNLPRKIPIVLVGRLAVDTEAQGRGIGSILLVDALRRTVRVASEVGVSVILVDAKDSRAAMFYQHFGFQPLPDSSNRLALSVSTASSLFSP